MLVRHALATSALALALISPANAPRAEPIAEAIESGDLALAARRAEDAAERDDLDAQHDLSLFYWHGVAKTQNFETALRWSTLAAVRGHAKAAAARRAMLRRIDAALAPKAMDWARKRLAARAEAGDDAALVALARSYAPEFGAANDAEAYVYACLAVSLGQSEARRWRDGLAATLKPGDLAKAQQRANEWMQKFRAAS